MLIAGVVFLVLGFFFPPFWIVGIVLIILSLFGSTIKVIFRSLWISISAILGLSKKNKE